MEELIIKGFVVVSLIYIIGVVFGSVGLAYSFTMGGLVD